MTTAFELAYVRKEEEPVLAPPRSEVGAVHWLRSNLFSSTTNTILTLLAIALVVWAIPPIIRWAFIDAAWTGKDREVCAAPGVGACWPFVQAKFWQFMYGRYPIDERWRVNLVAVLLVIGLVAMAVPRIPFKKQTAIYLLIVFPISAYMLLLGGRFGLGHVETSLWGGLLVTLVVAIVGIVASLPIGILLALGRRSKLPIVRIFSVSFIEFVRGVPLITVLFMASVMLVER